ncbi:MAG: LysR family transcriptional regulator [Halieaceae bacterium]|jgi:LysR family transcriptional regulator, carnitine catabolism transcriptional activator|nr:LysR family transcriptional regulator [Halieaceae bacterium]
MNIRHLEFVVAVAEYKNFTKAAEAVHISQPSLSHAVATIEKQIGTSLFHRLGRTVALTSAGEAFVESARVILRDLAVLHESVRSVNELESGHLDIAAPQSTAAGILADAVGLFRTQFPGISLRIQTSENAHDIERLVRTGKCELALTTEKVAPPLLEEVCSVQSNLAVFPPGTDVQEGVLPHSAFAGKPLIVPTGIYQYYGGFLLDIPSGLEQPVLAVETDSRQALIPLVLSGAGITFLPTGLATHAQRLGCVVREINPPLTQEIRLIMRQGPLSPAALEFRRAVYSLNPETSAT